MNMMQDVSNYCVHFLVPYDPQLGPINNVRLVYHTPLKGPIKHRPIHQKYGTHTARSCQ